MSQYNMWIFSLFWGDRPTPPPLKSSSPIIITKKVRKEIKVFEEHKKVRKGIENKDSKKWTSR
jgi:hypothetical protein